MQWSSTKTFSIGKILHGAGAALVAISCLVACDGRSGKVGAEPKATSFRWDTEPPRLPPIDRVAVGGGNGEGYNGPTFEFELIPRETEREVLDTHLARAMDRCFFGHDPGLKSALMRFLRYVYGPSPDQALRSEAEALYANKPGTYLATPFPHIKIDTSITPEFELIGRYPKLAAGSRRNFLVRLLDPVSRKWIGLRTGHGLPHFINIPASMRYLAENIRDLRYSSLQSGDLYYLPGPIEVSHRLYTSAFPERDEETSLSPYEINTQEYLECILSESQLLAMESRAERDLRMEYDRIERKGKFLSQFEGRLTTPNGFSMELARDGKVVIEFSKSRYLPGPRNTVVSDPDRNRCVLRAEGSVQHVYLPTANGAISGFAEVARLQEQYPKAQLFAFIDFRDIRVVRIEGPNGAPVDTDLSIGCDRNPHGLVDSWRSKRELEPDGRMESQIVWPLKVPAASHFEILTYEHPSWTLRAPRSALDPDLTGAYPHGTPELCSIVDSWKRERGALLTGPQYSLASRNASQVREYEARVGAAKAIFARFQSQGRLPKEMLDYCLQGDPERENFLNTLYFAFFRETLESIAKKKDGAPSVTAFLDILKAKDVLARPPLFRMTGHLASETPSTAPGGFLREGRSIYLDPTSVTPAEWTILWVHEVAHLLDHRARGASEIYSALAVEIDLEKAPTVLDEEKTDRLLKAGLERGLLSEQRAWAITFAVYQDLRAKGLERVEWMEKALSMKGREESLSAYTWRLLRAMNESHMPKGAWFESPLVAARLEKSLEKIWRIDWNEASSIESILAIGAD